MEFSVRHFTLFYISLLTLTSRFARGQESLDCPADGRMWVPFNRNCYHFVHGEEDVAKSYTFQDAKDMCRGYELLMVRSLEENEFIVNYIPSVWKSKMQVWLGLYYDSDEDVFRWHGDKSELGFRNWEEGGADDTDLPLMDTCVALHSSTGKWENISCSDELENGVVCQSKAVLESPQSTNKPLLSALVIISVVLILLLSAVVWFVQQRNNPGSSILSLIEYHPPFRAPSSDQTGLVDAEEINESP